MAEFTGGEVVAKMLSQENVETVFGIIDGTYFGFYSNLEPNGIQLITPRHETSAAHMAGAYARSSGKLGVCMASNGPGVANILPGLVVEQGEGNRVLVITSSRRTGIMYPDRGGTYQCFDQTGTIKQIAKWSEAVPSFDRIPELMRTALRECYNGRPGVVHLDIPENILNSSFKSTLNLQQPHQYRLTENPSPSDNQVKQAANLLAEAKFPIIHAGSGVIHAQAYDVLETVAKQLQAMVTTSWAGRGAMRESSPLTMPMTHIETNNQIRNEADLVLVLGSRVGETDWWGKAPYWNPDQTMIQVDLDPSTIGRNKPVELGIQADINIFLEKLSDTLQDYIPKAALKRRQSTIKKYVQACKKYRKKLNEKLEERDAPMNPAHVSAMAQDVFSRQVPVVADGGNTTIWANFFTSIEKPGGIYSTFKFGMLGAGVAQALGVAATNPEEPVLCVIGDGAMGFHPQEIETAVRNNLNVIYLVVCDKQWGMVKINQNIALRPVKTLVKKSLDDHENINSDLGEIAFDQMAQSMGAHGERVSDPHALREALKRAKQLNQCTVIHCDVDPVKHMWAPGLKYFKDMHDEPKGK
ncbi:thiamine pyrophosphate-binding protein [Alkalibacillus salilacus]|uniref:Acetolactate synthase-1/2/3 large subunit n=1 Tax=Alkalibacillus salilacus TaxID=284582 RepID=A0ABT9VIM5_9BACI|nr:thiamine pyrophosphate-binding protein [Alkalibacillus salilacus]MDQ0160810.1 acetolactate synthase-1/2/3 large subunit [Alkalibacillus salilacus]